MFYSSREPRRRSLKGPKVVTRTQRGVGATRINVGNSFLQQAGRQADRAPMAGQGSLQPGAMRRKQTLNQADLGLVSCVVLAEGSPTPFYSLHSALPLNQPHLTWRWGALRAFLESPPACVHLSILHGQGSGSTLQAVLSGAATLCTTDSETRDDVCFLSQFWKQEVQGRSSCQ